MAVRQMQRITTKVMNEWEPSRGQAARVGSIAWEITSPVVYQAEFVMHELEIALQLRE
jgi:hypothetical protein